MLHVAAHTGDGSFISLLPERTSPFPSSLRGRSRGSDRGSEASRRRSSLFSPCVRILRLDRGLTSSSSSPSSSEPGETTSRLFQRERKKLTKVEEGIQWARSSQTGKRSSSSGANQESWKALTRAAFQVPRKYYNLINPQFISSRQQKIVEIDADFVTLVYVFTQLLKIAICCLNHIRIEVLTCM